MTFVVAAAQYPIGKPANWDEFAGKLHRWVEDAARKGASLLVFPEYASMELAAIDLATMGDLAASLRFVAELGPQVDRLHAELAQRYGVHILAGTIPVEIRKALFVNRARLFAPNGNVGFQDKIVMTRFEREQWLIWGAQDLAVFDTALGRIGISICYDSEFPLLARALVDAGAEILLIPSCTDTLAGYSRVRLGAQARALEGQFYAVQAATVGQAAWSPALDINRGAAGVFGPPDLGFPADGVIALGKLDEPQWLYATIDIDLVAQVRSHGAVLNMKHWLEQPGAEPLPSVRAVSLSTREDKDAGDCAQPGGVSPAVCEPGGDAFSLTVANG